VGHQALFAVCEKCAEGTKALRGQIQMRDNVCKVKNKSVNTGSGNAEVAIARLMATLPSVVTVPLPKEPPPPPAP
jgi:hypothetical protein